MRNFRAISIALSLASSLATSFSTSSALAADRTISGVVVSAAGDPLPGATVTLTDESGRILGAASTNSKGAWRLVVTETPVGRVQVRVHVEGIADSATMITDEDLVVRSVVGATAGGGIDVEVKGDKALPPPPPESPTRYAITGELMTKLPGTRGDPFAAAASLPSMGRPPALSTIYIVRGAGPEETGTFVDGAPLPHAFHFGGLVAVVPAAFVESIAIAPGGFGVAYGRATAGIVDVTLASPRSDGVHGSLALDAIDVGIYASTPIGANTRVAAGARRSHVDAWIGKLLGDRVAGDLPRYLDGQALIERDFTDRLRGRVGIIAADDSVNVSDPNAPAEKPRSGSWASRVTRLHARVDGKLGETGTVFGVIALTRSSDTIIGELDQWIDARKTFYARLEGSGDIGERRFEDGGARLTVGVDTLATHIDGTRVLTIPTSSFGGSAVFAMRGAITVERVEPAAYVQLALKPTMGVGPSPIKNLTVISGVRVDRAPFGEVSFQPRVSIRADVSSTTAIKAIGGLYARPNVLDAVNARDYRGTYLPIAAEAGPVHGVQVGAGVEQALGSGALLFLDVYGRSATGVLVPSQQPAKPIYAERLAPPPAKGEPPTPPIIEGYDYPLYSDTGRARAVGIEALLQFKIGADVVGFLGYALARAEVREGPFAPWRRAPLDQTHVLNAAVLVQLGAGWDFGLRFRFAAGVLDSPYPGTDIAPKNDPNLDPNRQLTELAPLHSLDVRLEKKWLVGKSGVIAAYAEVRNVYDRRAREPLAYNYVYNYPVVGDGLPIIPNLGVKGSF